MRPKHEKSVMNRYLASHGIATLDEPQALFATMAMAIKTEEQFQKFLMKVDPTERRNAYEAIAPRLSFRTEPLSVYESRERLAAEVKQLPTYNRETFEVKDFRPAEIRTTPIEPLAKLANRAKELLSQISIGLICRLCTKERVFHGATAVDATIEARKAGWLYDKVLDKNVCPKCAKGRGITH